VAARVLHAADGSVLLQIPGGQLVTHSADHGGLRPGDLVAIDASGALARVHAHPTGEYPTGTGPDRALCAPDMWTRLARRAEILGALRAFFVDQGFLEVETPTVVASPGTEVHLAPTTVRQQASPGAAIETRYLITSPEYHMKRMLAAGSPPIFQLCKTFRDGERGGHHRPEFTMLEWYRPWSSLGAILADCEALIRQLAGEPSLTYQGQTVDLTLPWPRHPFLELLRDRGGVSEPERLSPDEQMGAFVDHVDPTLGRDRPEFVVDYPIAMASLAQPCAHDPSVAERAELYVAGLEIANAFGELVDPDIQRARCQADNLERRTRGFPELPLDEAFLGALTDGMPPSGGIALGVDRLVMLLVDAAHIDEVVAF